VEKAQNIWILPRCDGMMSGSFQKFESQEERLIVAKKHRFLEQLGGKDLFEDEDTGFDDGASQDERNDFAALLDQTSAQSFARLKNGDRIQAKVLAVTESSVIFDVGQRSEGVLPTEQMSAEERQGYRVGETYTVYVAQTKNGIELATSISAKQSGMDGLRDAMQSGLPVEGKVVGENKGGYNVELPGVRGFCPFSQMDIVSGKPPAQYIGQTFKFKVTKVQGRDVVLSRSVLLREQQAHEREKVLASLKEGDTLSAKVVKLESFGAFVDIGGGLNALVPMSELSWSRPSSAHSVVGIGDEVVVKILKIDSSGERPKVSASMKQVEGDPWDHTVASLETGSIADVRVTKLMPFGVFAEIKPGVEGLIHVSELSARRRISTPGEVVKIGDVVQAKITGIDRIQRRISLSMKVLDTDYIEQEGKKRLEKTKNPDDEFRGVEIVTKGATSSLGEALLRAAKK
jgi:small subunit ribosomal protein S1